MIGPWFLRGGRWLVWIDRRWPFLHRVRGERIS